MYNPPLTVFMTNKIPSGVEKYHESTEPESSRAAKMFSFFLLSSFFFRWASSILRELLTVVYTWNSSIVYRAVHNPITFSQLQSLTRGS